MLNNYFVSIKADTSQRVLAVNSSAFLSNADGYTQIDEGVGDRYHHAQGNYFSLPLVDMDGTHNYKLEGTTVREATAAEKQAELAQHALVTQQPSVIDHIEAQATYTAMMTNTLLPAAAESEDATNV